MGSAKTLLAALFLVDAFGTISSADFVDNNGPFQFIYHEHHNLLLVVQNDTCYFATIHDKIKGFMQGYGWALIQEEVITLINSRDDTRISSASLEVARDEFEDRLADYHCLNKQVFILDFDLRGIAEECQFESGWCKFTQDTQDDFDWQLDTGGTSTVGTGPTGDHSAYGLGQYAYTESSYPRVRGEKARLISQVINNTAVSDHCIGFYYNMHGSDIGELNVYIIDPGTSFTALPSPHWHESRDQGPAWKRALLSIQKQNEFQVVFEGVVGNGPRGDIALDDILIFAGDCSMARQFAAAPSADAHYPRQVRLFGTATAGRLEVQIQNHWATVCSDGFTDNDAAVACHMLGYTSGSFGVFRSGSFPAGHGMIWTDVVNCDGTETDFSQCDIQSTSVTNCQHGDDVAITCGQGCVQGNATYREGEQWTSTEVCEGTCTCILDQPDCEIIHCEDQFVWPDCHLEKIPTKCCPQLVCDQNGR